MVNRRLAEKGTESAWIDFNYLNQRVRALSDFVNPTRQTAKCLIGFATKLLERGGHEPFYSPSTLKMKQSIDFSIEELSTSKAEACLPRTERVSVSSSTNWTTVVTPIWSTRTSRRQECYWQIWTRWMLISMFPMMTRGPIVEQCSISHPFMRNARAEAAFKGIARNAWPDRLRRRPDQFKAISLCSHRRHMRSNSIANRLYKPLPSSVESNLHTGVSATC
jgi:hypothetical protein